MAQQIKNELENPASDHIPMVVIGVPTHNRPELLRRALDSIANQDYPNIKVLVADNCSPGTQTEETVNAFRKKIATLEYTKHPNNIGSLNNFFWLLERADGEYFMWLADDDEISGNYVSSLASLLSSDCSISTATGHWVSMRKKDTAVQMESSSFPQRNSLLRCMKYTWATDDAFFYGVHRTALLKKASFSGYYWPNRDVLINWAYVFLFDMVIQGRVVLTKDPTVQFINHDYTEKQYIATEAKRLSVFFHISRRFNVHVLYLIKARQSIGFLAALILACVSLLSLSREILFVLKAYTVVALKIMIRNPVKTVARNT